MNYDDRRARMVLVLRQAGVLDTGVLAAMESIPRERVGYGWRDKGPRKIMME